MQALIRVLFLLTCLIYLNACGQGVSNSDGLSSLLVQNDFSTDEHCPNGGVKLQSGIDNNGNNILDADEVDATSYVCKGDAGEQGPAGTTGLAGGNGAKGDNGLNSLIAISDEAPGSNCTYGGKRVEAGVDLNQNGILDGAEATEKAFLCKDNPKQFNGLLFTDDSGVPGKNGIYAVEEDGSGLRKIAGTYSPDGYINRILLSPSRNHVAYRYMNQSKKIELHITDLLSNREPIRVTDQTDVLDWIASWSPVEDRVAYLKTMSDTGRVELFSIFADGTGNLQHSLSEPTTTGVYWDFQWSPDGQSIAYRTANEQFKTTDLYIADVNSQNWKRISGNIASDKNVLSYEWSPDGKNLALRVQDGGNRILYVVKPDGSGLLPVSIPSVDLEGVRSFKWAPDSSRILYSLAANQWGEIELFAVAPDGTSHTQISGDLISGGSVGFYAWAPDSSAVLYHADQDIDNIFELYVTNATGENNRKITGELGNIPSSHFIYWSPGSDRVAFREKGVLYIAMADGTELINVIAETGLQDIESEGMKWSKSGDYLYFTGRRILSTGPAEIFRVTADGSNFQQVSYLLDEGSTIDLFFQFTPNGEKLIYYIWGPESVTLHSINVDGTDHHALSGTTYQNQFVYEAWSSEYMTNDD